MWTAARIEKVLSDCGVTVTKVGPLQYLARLINEEVQPEKIPFAQDNVVIWKDGWPLSTITVDKEGPQ